MRNRRARAAVIWRRLSPGESISSLYARVCRANAMSLHELGSLMLGRTIHSATTGDMDVMPGTALVSAFATHTGHSRVEVDFATLAPFESRLSTLPWRFGRPTRWVLERIRRTDQRRHGHWTQLCSKCLREDHEPYFRLFWRMAWLTECPIHGVALLDRCPDCGANLDFLAGSQGEGRLRQLRPLSTCPSCGVDWRKEETAPSCPIHLDWQRKLVDGVFEGWTTIGPDSVMSSLYLDGIYNLQRALRLSEEGNALFNGMLAQLGIELRFNSAGRQMDRLLVDERRAILRCVSRLLEDWPEGFVAASRRFNFRWNALGELSRERLPFWLESVGREWTNRTWYQPSTEEARSVVHMLKTRGLHSSHVLVREWLGAAVSKPILAARQVPLAAPRQFCLTGILPPTSLEEFRRSFVRMIVKTLRMYIDRNIQKTKIRRPTQMNLQIMVL